jgi:hypothetical protein
MPYRASQIGPTVSYSFHQAGEPPRTAARQLDERALGCVFLGLSRSGFRVLRSGVWGLGVRSCVVLSSPPLGHMPGGAAATLAIVPFEPATSPSGRRTSTLSATPNARASPSQVRVFGLFLASPGFLEKIKMIKK